jgi:putative serine protease PepD
MTEHQETRMTERHRGPDFVLPPPAPPTLPPTGRPTPPPNGKATATTFARFRAAHAPEQEPPVPRSSRAAQRIGAVAVGVLLVGGGLVAGPTAQAWLTERTTAPGDVALSAPSGDSPAGAVTAIARSVLPSVVQVDVRSRRGSGTGSGFVVAGGLVLTNAHVVGSSRTVTVRTADDRQLTATVVGTDDDADVAVLRLPAGANLPALGLGDPNTLEVGDPVVAFGSPFGLTGTVTSGIVSAVNRRTSIGQALQTDAAINPGNSGGPLVDGAGRVVGINTMIATAGGGGNVGIGFAVPIDIARRVAGQIQAQR